jgi:hypothetical protein
VITAVQPAKIAADMDVRIVGILFGETKQGNDLLVKSADTGAEDYMPYDRITDWTDTAILFKVPPKFPRTGREPKDKLSVTVRTAAEVSNAIQVTT